MSNRVMYLLPALVLAALALVLALVGLSRSSSAPAEAPQTAGQAIESVVQSEEEKAPEYNYWLANSNLSLGHQLEAKDLTQITTNAKLPQAIAADKDLKGITLRRNVRAGEMLSKDDFDAISLLTKTVPAGHRALAISVNDVIAAGGLLKPGDLVDVLASFRKAGELKQPFVMTVLKQIQVLAVGDFVIDEVPDEKDKKKRRSGGTAVLAVPEEDVNKLLLFEKNASLQLAVIGNRNLPMVAADKASDEVSNEASDKTRNEEGQEKVSASATSAKGNSAESTPANKPPQLAKADNTKAGDAKAQAKKVGLVTLEDVIPQLKPKKPAKAPAAKAKPAGHKVEIFEGGKSRSTHVK